MYRKHWKRKLCGFHGLKSVVKVRIAQNNSQVSEGGITVKPGQESIHELIINLKVNPSVASATCTRYQIAFKRSVIVWLELFSIRWDGKYFNGSNFYLELASNLRKMSRQKFRNELACVFTTPCARKNVDWNKQQLTDGGILADRNSANHPYCFLSNQKEFHILAFLHVICERIVSYSRGHDRGLRK